MTDVPFRALRVLRWRATEGLEDDPSYLATGKNGGYQAINLAVHLGASKIILLGYDMQKTGGVRHWHGDHPAGLSNPDDSAFKEWLRLFPTMVEPLKQRGVEVINCSRETALTCFPRASLEDAL